MSFSHPAFDIPDAELMTLPEDLVGEMSAGARTRYVQLRAFVFIAERMLRKLASTLPQAERGADDPA